MVRDRPLRIWMFALSIVIQSFFALHGQRLEPLAEQLPGKKVSGKHYHSSEQDKTLLRVGINDRGDVLPLEEQSPQPRSFVSREVASSRGDDLTHPVVRSEIERPSKGAQRADRRLDRQLPKRDSRQHRRAAKGWKFPGPEPLPILEDARLTQAEKEKELGRVIEKLHLEFKVKKKMGHSRLREARTAFYDAVADHKALTGRDRPSNFDFEDLPDVADGAAELQEDEAEDVDGGYSEDDLDASSNVVFVPDQMPECMEVCKGHNAVCFGDSRKWTAGEACSCLRHWQRCAIDSGACTREQRDTDGFFVALNTRESEVCAWPSGDLYENLHIKLLTHRPANTTAYADAGDASTGDKDPKQSLMQDRRQRNGFRLSRLSLPLGCQVSHPEMLGDGDCDGGNYNTEACNWDGGDCCDEDCRPALHRCGVDGYKCLGRRMGVKVHENFKCDRSRVDEFKLEFAYLRDTLTLGKSMVSAECSQLTVEEHQHVASAFNMGVELGWRQNINSAAAVVGGPELFLDCDLWDNELGSDWFGSILTHELGHTAGYSHPKFKTHVFPSECENIGSTYCKGHCMEWISACENHLIFGSESCGFGGLGCKTTCVHKDYCNSLPERLTECFGYQKVHSRGETTAELLQGYAGKATAVVASAWSTLGKWLGFSGARRSSVSLPVVLAAFLATLCAMDCDGVFGRK